MYKMPTEKSYGENFRQKNTERYFKNIRLVTMPNKKIMMNNTTVSFIALANDKIAIDVSLNYSQLKRLDKFLEVV